MAGLKACFRLGQASLRRFSTARSVKSAIRPEDHPAFKKLKRNQELFQKEDMVEEVFIKGGVQDVFIYKAIAALTVLGLVYDVKILYNLAYNS